MINYIEDQDIYLYGHIPHLYKQVKFEIMHKNNIWKIRECLSPYKGEWIVTSDILRTLNELHISIDSLNFLIQEAIDETIIYFCRCEKDYNEAKLLMRLVGKDHMRTTINNFKLFEQQLQGAILSAFKPKLRLI